MIYKFLSFMVIVIFLFGADKSFAQEEPCDCACDCIETIEAAVDAVMGTSGCDDDALWEAPHALEVHLAKLQNWCGVQNKPLKSKIPNIVAGMLETIEDAYAGESYVDLLTGETVWVNIPAPECAVLELGTLQGLLENGCPVE